MSEQVCSREPEALNGWQECHRCEAIWGPLLHKTGWRPGACPERIRGVGDLIANISAGQGTAK